MKTYRDLNDYEIMYMVEENEDAKELLFDKYRPIILNMANKYKNDGKRCGLEVDDLIQEGYLGLNSAINNYNAKQNTLFYTYAILSIRSKILNCLRMNNNQKNFCLNTSISLSQPLSDDNSVTVSDCISGDRSMCPDEIFEENNLLINVKSFMFSLDLIHASVFELHLNGFSNINIAYLLNIGFKDVANYLYNIRKSLRKYLI